MVKPNSENTQLPHDSSEEDKALFKIQKQQEATLLHNARLAILEDSNINMRTKVKENLNNLLHDNLNISKDLSKLTKNIINANESNKAIREELKNRGHHLTDDLSDLDTEMPNYTGPESD